MPKNRRTLAALTGVAVVVSAAVVVYYETRLRERDYHEILGRVARLGKLIQAHDVRIWLQVEERHATVPEPERHAAHVAMLRDFDRLGHLEGFSMSDIRVELSRDTAVVRYHVQGLPRAGDARAPAAGEMHFARGPTGWELVGHRLLEPE